jgi:hypothetical protein
MMWRLRLWWHNRQVDAKLRKRRRLKAKLLREGFWTLG